MAEAPKKLTETPDAAVPATLRAIPEDALSSVLSIVRMRGELVCSSEFSAPFSVAFPAGPSHFHAVQSGEAWVLADSRHPPLRIAAGSFVLFPRGDGHVVSDAAGREPVPLAVAARDAWDETGHTFRTGGGGSVTRMLCARFRYANPLADQWLDALPHLIVVGPDRAPPSGWLDLTAQAMNEEAVNPRAGSAVMVARLLDLAFVQMLRLWSEERHGQPGWLAGAADLKVSKALAAIHGAPARLWSVAELARCAGLSRSSFAARFVALVGTSPAAYIGNWRMNLVADMLGSSQEPVGSIAHRMGYDSEAGFSRAFKTRFGMSPSNFRARSRERVG